MTVKIIAVALKRKSILTAYCLWKHRNELEKDSRNAFVGVRMTQGERVDPEKVETLFTQNM